MKKRFLIIAALLVFGLTFETLAKANKETSMTSDSSESMGAPPPAPFIGPDYKACVELLKLKKNLPITLGMYSPKAVIEINKAVYQLRLLEEAKPIKPRQVKPGESYMPEMDWQNLVPGKVLFGEKDLGKFIQGLKKHWDKDWG